ncbi:hypothetical protein MTO96_028778 [Rhipicephalus appendiculatus]
MQILRAELTQHPRGSLSAPVLSEYYLMPPVSLTCTAVSQLPDQVPISSSTASLLACAGSQSSPTLPREPISVATATGSTDTSSLRCPQGKSLPRRTLKRACLAAALFVGIVAALVMSDQLFQRSGLADDTRLTEAALRPLVDEPPSEIRGVPRGYAFGRRDEGRTTATTTITSVTEEEESQSTETTGVSMTSTRRSHRSTRRRVSSSSRRGQRGISRRHVGSRKRSRTSRKASPPLHLTSRRGQKRHAHRLRTKKVQRARPSRKTRFGTRHGRLLEVTREIHHISLEEAASRTAAPPKESGGIMTTQLMSTKSTINEESAESTFA